jgi:hypothetical protein
MPNPMANPPSEPLSANADFSTYHLESTKYQKLKKEIIRIFEFEFENPPLSHYPPHYIDTTQTFFFRLSAKFNAF